MVDEYPAEAATKGKTPLDVYPDLADECGRVLFQLHRHSEIFEKAMAAINAAGIGIRYTDQVAVMAALNRSAALLHGFLTLLDEWNMQGALCLLRSHLDELLVVHYLPSTPDPEMVSRDIMDGMRITDMIDPSDPKGKKRLTYAALRQCAKKANPDLDPWIDEVYRMASEFTHFSRPACAAAIESVDEKSGTISFSFGTPSYREDLVMHSRDQIENWLGHMGYATMVLLDWIERYVAARTWAARRSKPN